MIITGMPMPRPVQYVNATFDVKYCDEKPVHLGPPSSHPVHPSDWPFYEGWSIPPNEAHPPRRNTMDDYWQMPGFGYCTKGTITITGTAEYFDGYGLPADFYPDHAGPP